MLSVWNQGSSEQKKTMLSFPVLLWDRFPPSTILCAQLLPFTARGAGQSMLPASLAQPPPSKVPAKGVPLSRHRNWKGPPLQRLPVRSPGPGVYTIWAHWRGRRFSRWRPRDSGPHVTLGRALKEPPDSLGALLAQDTGSLMLKSCWSEKCSDTKFCSTPDESQDFAISTRLATEHSSLNWAQISHS